MFYYDNDNGCYYGEYNQCIFISSRCALGFKETLSTVCFFVFHRFLFVFLDTSLLVKFSVCWGGGNKNKRYVTWRSKRLCGEVSKAVRTLLLHLCLCVRRSVYAWMLTCVCVYIHVCVHLSACMCIYVSIMFECVRLSASHLTASAERLPKPFVKAPSTHWTIDRIWRKAFKQVVA